MIGDEILKQRIGKNLSIFELSKLTGVDKDVISRLETHDRKFLSKENFIKLSKVIDLTEYQEYIYSDTGTMLGLLLKDARMSMGYTQLDVAIKAGYKGYTKISQLENGAWSKISEETFTKLANALPLKRETFEPFIQKSRKLKGRIIVQNRDRIQKLVSEKRTSLSISKIELGKRANVCTNFITNIELHPEHPITTSKLLKVMYILRFSKDEILSCFSNLEEEDLEIFFQNMDNENPIYEKKRV